MYPKSDNAHGVFCIRSENAHAKCLCGIAVEGEIGRPMVVAISQRECRILNEEDVLSQSIEPARWLSLEGSVSGCLDGGVGELLDGRSLTISVDGLLHYFLAHSVDRDASISLVLYTP